MYSECHTPHYSSGGQRGARAGPAAALVFCIYANHRRRLCTEASNQ